MDNLKKEIVMHNERENYEQIPVKSNHESSQITKWI